MAYFDPQDKRLKEALERFEIKAWSFSTLEMWRDSPARGLMKALNLPVDPVGLAAIIGNATEKGVELALTGTPVDEAIEFGLTYRPLYKGEEQQSLMDFMSFEDPAEVKSVRTKTAQRIKTGYNQMKDLGVPKTQVPIFYEADWSPIPITGYADFVFEEQGLIIDTKAPGQKPTQNKVDSYMRQGAIYTHNTNQRFQTLVLLPDGKPRGAKSIEPRHFSYELEDAATSLEEVKHTIGAICKILTLSNDPMEIAAHIIPDYSHFRLNGVVTRQSAKKLFGY